MQLVYTRHAHEKFQMLKRHGFPVTEDQVEATVLHPDAVFEQSGGRRMAQKSVSERHVLRVIYRIDGNAAIVITFYPGRKERYESDL